MGKGAEAGESVVHSILYSIKVKGENIFVSQEAGRGQSALLYHVKKIRFLS